MAKLYSYKKCPRQTHRKTSRRRREEFIPGAEHFFRGLFVKWIRLGSCGPGEFDDPEESIFQTPAFVSIAYGETELVGETRCAIHLRFDNQLLPDSLPAKA
jgi:hypothetical protein